MDLEPEPIKDVVEEETDRGIRRPFIEDDEDENGVDCLRYWKGEGEGEGELLRPLDEEAAIDRKAKKIILTKILDLVSKITIYACV